jgi:phosphoribosylanthranilate isomerase
MKTKVCGLKDVENIKVIDRINFDMMGFIFYPKSPRYVTYSEESVTAIREIQTDKVGVFVDSELEEIFNTIELFKLDMVQLHGNETAEMVSRLSSFVPVIKVFNVDEKLPDDLLEYTDADLFLFDTKGEKKGGNGIKFNWEILEDYRGSTPFLLSGGIHLKDLDTILEIKHPKLAGIDVNSGFEIEAGLKNIELLKELKARTNEVFC